MVSTQYREDLMITINYTIKDSDGIHTRPAGMLVKLAAGFKSNITFNCGEKTANMKKLFALMSLGIKKGENIDILIEGEDEIEASKAIETFMMENL
jgi:phosphocarrier protein HPr